jgi:hypothetical protein
MENEKNVRSRMSLAAMKAWETRRKNAASSSSVRKDKNDMKEKRRARTVKEVSNEIKQVVGDVVFKADEKREMMALNGTEMEQLARKTQRHLDRKEVFDEAKNGIKQKPTIAIGGINGRAKIERFNGGIKVIEV